MNSFNNLKKINELLNKINELKQLVNNNSLYFNDHLFDYLKKTNFNTYISNISLDHYSRIKSYYSLDETFNKINKNIEISDLLKETINLIDNNKQWNDLTKISILYNLSVSTVENDSYEEPLLDINNISSNANEFDKNIIFHINNFLNLFSDYLERNPLAKVSFYIFQSLLLAYVSTKIFSPTEPNITINNNVYVSRSIRNEVNATVNVEELNLRSYARNNAKKTGALSKNTEVEVLKDNLKWVFIFEKNTAQSGWVRKEYLKYKFNRTNDKK